MKSLVDDRAKLMRDRVNQAVKDAESCYDASSDSAGRSLGAALQAAHVVYSAVSPKSSRLKTLQERAGELGVRLDNDAAQVRPFFARFLENQNRRRAQAPVQQQEPARPELRAGVGRKLDRYPSEIAPILARPASSRALPRPLGPAPARNRATGVERAPRERHAAFEGGRMAGDARGQIIDGKAIAEKVRAEVRAEVERRRAAGHRAPGLATVLVGEDPASHVYVRNKRKQSAEVGIESFHIDLPAEASESRVLDVVDELNRDERVDGILVQLPLPKHIDETKVIRAIDPDKDVDGFHPENVARLVLGLPGFVPCTPTGCMRLLDELSVDLEGAHAVVVGRSNIVGKPMAQLLLQRNATVTIAHSRTRDLAAITRQADVLIVAVGRLHLVGRDHVKDGAVVLDVGMNKKPDGKLAGDVDFEAVRDKCRAITPVPKGVGPMTIAMLLSNTLRSHAWRLGIADPT